MPRNSKNFGDQIREAVGRCGKAQARISRETGISESRLSQFMGGTKGLSLAALNDLADCIGIRVIMTKKTPRKRR